MITVWHQSTARAIPKHKNPSALLSLSRFFDVTQWSFCQRCFKSNTPIVYRPNIWQTHGGRAEPRGEHRRMLKRKQILIQTSRRKLHIRYSLIDKIYLSPSPNCNLAFITVVPLCKVKKSMISFWTIASLQWHFIIFQQNVKTFKKKASEGLQSLRLSATHAHD